MVMATLVVVVTSVTCLPLFLYSRINFNPDKDLIFSDMTVLKTQVLMDYKSSMKYLAPTKCVSCFSNEIFARE